MRWIDAWCEGCEDGAVLVAEPAHELDVCLVCGEVLVAAQLEQPTRAVAIFVAAGPLAAAA